MSLMQTRPEKSLEMTKLVYAIREATVGPARDGQLNLAEVINGFAQVLASVLVGAYDAKSREIVVSTFPDVVRAYYPAWEKIYAEHTAAVTQDPGSTPMTDTTSKLSNALRAHAKHAHEPLDYWAAGAKIALNDAAAELDKRAAGWETAFNIGVSEQGLNKRFRATLEKIASDDPCGKYGHWASEALSAGKGET